MRSSPRALLLAALLLSAPVPGPARLAAQVVRGTVTQGTSGAPVAGALVELLTTDSAGVRVASALTDPAGAFALRAPVPGRYVLGAKRIGVRRVTTDAFSLAAGETRSIAIALEPVDFRLPEVVIMARAPCVAGAREGEPTDERRRERVNALWDEVRTALDAAEISLRDRLFTAQVTRYARELEPRTRRVLQEGRSEVRGAVGSPLGTPAPESLSIHGYWRATSAGATLFHVPDPAALLSDAFEGEHCFSPVTGRGTRQGLAGLAFVPAAARSVPGVRGTFWLDERSSELRLVEFSYDRVPTGVDSALVGGEVHFTRLGSGAWIVRRWFLRVPVAGRPAQLLATEGSAPWVLVRPQATSLLEEGAEVTTDELRAPVRLATITGVVRDSTSKRPLRDATVRLAGGTPRATVPDASGRFRFDGVTPGTYTLAVSTPGYDTLGVPAVERAVGPGDGETVGLTLAALDTRALTMRLCGGRAASWGRGTLHVTVRDSSTNAPLPGVTATARWMSTVGRPSGDSLAAHAEARTDERGMVALCDVPSERDIIVTLTHPERAPSAPMRLVIAAREVRRVHAVLGARAPTE